MWIIWKIQDFLFKLCYKWTLFLKILCIKKFCFVVCVHMPDSPWQWRVWGPAHFDVPRAPHTRKLALLADREGWLESRGGLKPLQKRKKRFRNVSMELLCKGNWFSSFTNCLGSTESVGIVQAYTFPRDFVLEQQKKIHLIQFGASDGFWKRRRDTTLPFS